MTPFKCQKEWTIGMTTGTAKAMYWGINRKITLYIHIYDYYVCIYIYAVVVTWLLKDLCIRIYINMHKTASNCTLSLVKSTQLSENVIIEFQLDICMREREKECWVFCCC